MRCLGLGSYIYIGQGKRLQNLFLLLKNIYLYAELIKDNRLHSWTKVMKRFHGFKVPPPPYQFC